MATLYDLFEGKEGLFRAVVESRCTVISETLEHVEMAGLSPAETLRLFAERIFDVVMSKENVALLRVVIAEAMQFPELGRTIFAARDEIVQANIQAYLMRQTQMRQLEVGEPAAAAAMFIEMVLGLYRIRLLCGVPTELTPEVKAAHLDRTVAAFLTATSVSAFE